MQTEAPNTRAERFVCAMCAMAAVLLGDWLWLQIVRNPDTNHTLRFVALGLLVLLVLDMLYLLFTLFTIRYALADDHLIIRQGLRRLVIHHGQIRLVQRWRRGWGWSGGALRDLGVEEITCFPPLIFGRHLSIWVIVYETNRGHRAAAIRPTHGLLEILKTWAPSRERNAS